MEQSKRIAPWRAVMRDLTLVGSAIVALVVVGRGAREYWVGQENIRVQSASIDTATRNIEAIRTDVARQDERIKSLERQVETLWRKWRQ